LCGLGGGLGFRLPLHTLASDAGRLSQATNRHPDLICLMSNCITFDINTINASSRLKAALTNSHHEVLMDAIKRQRLPARKDDRVIIHFVRGVPIAPVPLDRFSTD